MRRSIKVQCCDKLPVCFAPGHNGVWCFPITGMSCFIDGWTSGWRLPLPLPLLCSPCYYRNRCPCLPPFIIPLPPQQTTTHKHTHTCMQHKQKWDEGGILGSSIAWKFCWACESLGVCASVYTSAPRQATVCRFRKVSNVICLMPPVFSSYFNLLCMCNPYFTFLYCFS